MSLGEQHLFFRHQREPVGFPRKTDFYPLQCSTCQWFFSVQRILDFHMKNCDGKTGDTATTTIVETKSVEGNVKEQPTSTEKTSKAKSGVTRKRKARDEEGNLENLISAKIASVLKRFNVQPCKVVLTRSNTLESKMNANGNLNIKLKASKKLKT